MQSAMKYYDDVDSWKTVMFLYNSCIERSRDEAGDTRTMNFNMYTDIIRSSISRPGSNQQKVLWKS